MHIKQATPTLVPPPPSPDLCYAVGFDAWFAGRSYAEMVDEHMRAGWLEASQSGGKGYAVAVAQATQSKTSTVNYFLESDWIEAVEECIIAYPGNVAFAVEPALCGQYDAEQGYPCAPGARGYSQPADAEEYRTAWNDTAALMAETVDYREYQLDIEFIRRGGAGSPF